jgi:hypothetical protein
MLMEEEAEEDPSAASAALLVLPPAIAFLMHSAPSWGKQRKQKKKLDF